jgi:hypothetical protein
MTFFAKQKTPVAAKIKGAFHVYFQVYHYIRPDHIEAYKAATLKNAQMTILEPGAIRFMCFRI